MKRRAFIGLIGASALSLPFILGETGWGPGGRHHRITANKIPLRLNLPKDVETIVAKLGEKSKGVRLLGGPAIAAAAGLEPPYANLLMDTPHFTTVKQSLFEFGVTPISTPGLPGNFARFLYQDRSYNVVNMPFDHYAMQSLSGQQNELILFAHSFLIYDIQEGCMLDPYEALQAKSADGKSYVLKPVKQPKSLLQGFDQYLAATFDVALLGLKPSPAYQQIERRVFEATPTPADSRAIMGKMLDYAPDILEVAGLDSLCHLLAAPVCVAAARTDAEIDLLKIRAKLRRMQQRGGPIGGLEFMSAVDEALKAKPSGKGCAGGLPEYLATSHNSFRRIRILKEVVESGQPA